MFRADFLSRERSIHNMAGAKTCWTVCALLLVTLRSTKAGCSGPLGMTSRAIDDSQITASSTYSDFTKSDAARLRNTGSIEQLTFGGWCAEDADSDPYLQIDFRRETVVRQIATQGLEQPSGNWVTQYALNYSCDGTTWRTYKEDNTRKIFIGNDDASSIVRISLTVPIIAKFVRILPLDKKQYGLACLRVELYGCYEEIAAGFTECSVAVGMEDGRIPSAQISASSSTGDHGAASGRLNHVAQSTNGSVTWGAWCTDILDSKQYLQVDLGSVRNISGVATQGYNKGGWVTEYLVKYSLDGKNWETYRENITNDVMVFDANWDADTVTWEQFQRVFTARFVRFNPVTWYTPGSICMRVEVYECINYTGCSTATSTLEPTSHRSTTDEPLTPTPKPTEGLVALKADSSAARTTGTLNLIWVLLLASLLLVIYA